MTIKVSFIIAAYNEELHIKDCVLSCLNQTFKNIEVIVTDDGSNDHTLSILRSINDERIIVCALPKNMGKVVAFNNSYSKASGDYIAIIGADDINCLRRIESQLAFLSDNDLDITWSNFSHIDESGNKLTYNSPFKTNPTSFDLIEDNFMPGNTIFMKRSVASYVFPIPADLLFEDWWISFNSMLNFRYQGQNEQLIFYRIHSNNTVGNRRSNPTATRIKNLKRHFIYHNYFNKLLNGELLDYNSLVIFYKKICIEDDFKNRFALFIKFPIFFNIKFTKIYFKILIITVFGLAGVNKLRFVIN